MHDLMVRGGAPTSVAEARNSSDVALLRLAMLAAVGSCSPSQLSLAIAP